MKLKFSRSIVDVKKSSSFSLKIYFYSFLNSVLNFNVFCILNFGLETPQPTWPSVKFKNKHDHLIKDEFPFPFLKAFILRQFENYVYRKIAIRYLLGIRETRMIL